MGFGNHRVVTVLASAQETRSRCIDAFNAKFVRSPDFLVRAPGRVNLIGEHTDYCDGLVLPCAIDRQLWLAVGRREDGRMRIHPTDVAPDEGGTTEFDVSDASSTGGFADYAKGVIAALAERDVSTAGLDLAIASDLPIGSGLSSSAAFGVALCHAVLHAEGVRWELEQIARAAHRGESHFVGTQCGILDLFAVALGEENRALRIDCRDQALQSVSFPSDKLAILISDSGVHRKLAPGTDAQEASSGYRQRVAECRAALAAIRARGGEYEEITSIRDVGTDSLADLSGRLDPVLFRRLRHVVSENARVDQCVEALGRGDAEGFERVGELLCAGHASLRDDYEVSIPELDALCEDAGATPGVYGSRLTGAGFGGSALHLVERSAAVSASQEIAARFRARFGRSPTILAVRASEGATVEEQ